MKRDKILERIYTHGKWLVANGIKEKSIMGIFLYGSQNYKVDLPTSDVDTKAIYLPSYEEILFDPPKVKEYHLPNGEHCELMDIRHLIANFKKQNINFLEILFTDYYWIALPYEATWKKYFVNHREEIASYDAEYAAKSIIGQAKHTLNQNKLNGKKVANGLRLYVFLQDYFNKEYGEAIIPRPKVRKLIKQYKGIETLDSEYYADTILKQIELKEEKFYEKAKERNLTSNKEEIDENMRQGIISLLRGRELFF